MSVDASDVVQGADRTSRGRLWVRGSDRARFLHNLTTNDVKGLALGRGCEAFVTSLQGKTLGFGTLHAVEDGILVRLDPGVMARLMPHFAKYGALDDVVLEDVSATTEEVHLFGGGVGEMLAGDGIHVGRWKEYGIAEARTGAGVVWVVAEEPLGVPGWTLIGEGVRARGRGVRWLDAAESEAMRIEAGTPAFGVDLTDANLPQELDRDRRAISFVKGCYLGQETVARLDALGHVNKILRRLVFETAGPVAAGTALGAEGKPAGVVTSTAYSARAGKVLGLGMIRTAHAEAGTLLACETGEGRVAARVL